MTSEGTATSARSGPLTGLRVIELAGIGPAQLGCMLLADLGADVVRVDRAGDVPRTAPDGPAFDLLARGRRSIGVDLKAPEGVALVLDLVAGADVLVDPFRPGVCERLGIGPEPAHARSPGLVFARMTGWGQDGPLAQAAGHDVNYIAVAGALGAIGREDEVPHVPLNLVGDFGGGGMLMAFGIMAALWERASSGRGQVIDVAMVDGVASLMGSVLHLMAAGQWTATRGSNWLQGGAPWYGVYRTRDDRFVSVGPLEAKFYAMLLESLGLDPAEWPQFDTARWPALRALMEEIFAARTVAEWSAELEGTDVCFGPAVALDELTTHPHLAARGTYLEVDGVVQSAPVPRFDRTPGAIHRPAPWPGQHTEEILLELGASPGLVQEFIDSNVVAKVPA
jgi:alpha-methylacyl-CoA racemase